MKKKILFVIIPLTVVLLAFLLYNAAVLAFFESSVNNRIKTDIKRIDLSTLNSITIKNDGNEETLYPQDERFDIVKKTFDKKRLKKETEHYYEPEEGYYEITLHCEQNDYILYGCPYSYTDGSIDTPVYFVLYDYSNYNTMSYLYLYVSVSDKTFYEIFPNANIPDM